MAATRELRRQLGLLDATAINLGTMIGSGIFIVPAAIALALPATGPILAVWIVGGLVSLLGALCLAELGGAYPAAGGMFVYLREAFGPTWGYLYGWTTAIVINPAVHAAMPHPRYKGLTGTVQAQRGKAFEVKVRDGGKYRLLICGPEHLKAQSTE